MQTSLIHSTFSLLSDAPFGILRKVIFHDALGAQRSEILVSLLRLVAEASFTGEDERPPARALSAVEIGVCSGRNAAYLLERVPHLSLIGVDPFYKAEEMMLAVKRRLSH